MLFNQLTLQYVTCIPSNPQGGKEGCRWFSVLFVGTLRPPGGSHDYSLVRGWWSKNNWRENSPLSLYLSLNLSLSLSLLLSQPLSFFLPLLISLIRYLRVKRSLSFPFYLPLINFCDHIDGQWTSHSIILHCITLHYIALYHIILYYIIIYHIIL